MVPCSARISGSAKGARLCATACGNSVRGPHHLTALLARSRSQGRANALRAGAGASRPCQPRRLAARSSAGPKYRRHLQPQPSELLHRSSARRPSGPGRFFAGILLAGWVFLESAQLIRPTVTPCLGRTPRFSASETADGSDSSCASGTPIAEVSGSPAGLTSSRSGVSGCLLGVSLATKAHRAGKRSRRSTRRLSIHQSQSTWLDQRQNHLGHTRA
jgi:hypothetical protein